MGEPLRVMVGDDYPVVVGAGAVQELASLVGPEVQRVLVVHQPGRDHLVAQVRQVLEQRGATVLTETVPDGEAAKDVTVAARLWGALGRAGFTRSDLVVGLGGGATTDLAGFVAATWLRGVAVVHLPTTLLGVVDAAVGGKTGINTAEGKNLVGAFHTPAGVLCDPAWLGTMTRPDYVSGLAEVIKCGFIADPVILDLVRADPEAAGDPRHPVAEQLIGRAVQVKADVVTADLRESALREVLNYGHTFAHAIEQVEDYTWRHGDAVSVGMVYAAELAQLAGRIDPATVTTHRQLLTSVGLPTQYRSGRWPQLLEAMRRDKKSRGARLRFVVLDGIGRPGRLEGPPEELLRAAYTAVSG